MRFKNNPAGKAQGRSLWNLKRAYFRKLDGHAIVEGCKLTRGARPGSPFHAQRAARVPVSARSPSPRSLPTA